MIDRILSGRTVQIPGCRQVKTADVVEIIAGEPFEIQGRFFRAFQYFSDEFGGVRWGAMEVGRPRSVVPAREAVSYDENRG